MEYTFRRTKLSELYKEIGRYLRENGDADIRSIVSLNGDNEASYRVVEIKNLERPFYNVDNLPVEHRSEKIIEIMEVFRKVEELKDGYR